jgi:putative PIN family toxin of toxin-antitoxin system
MTSAILDTNVIVQAAIGSPRAASSRTVDALRNRLYRLVLSPETLNETFDVLSLQHIRVRHGWSDDEILSFLAFLVAHSDLHIVGHSVPASITRDHTDTALLGLAAESHAAYLVTNDRRHLLRLKRYGSTKIVTPTEFLRNLC